MIQMEIEELEGGGGNFSKTTWREMCGGKYYRNTKILANYFKHGGKD